MRLAGLAIHDEAFCMARSRTCRRPQDTAPLVRTRAPHPMTATSASFCFCIGRKERVCSTTWVEAVQGNGTPPDAPTRGARSALSPWAAFFRASRPSWSILQGRCAQCSYAPYNSSVPWMINEKGEIMDNVFDERLPEEREPHDEENSHILPCRLPRRRAVLR